MWQQRNLAAPEQNTFENMAEILIYKTINLIRLDPKWIIPYVRNSRNHAKFSGANIKLVLDRLENAEPMDILLPNQGAMNACRRVNSQIIDDYDPSCSKIRRTYVSMLNPAQKGDYEGIINDSKKAASISDLGSTRVSQKDDTMYEHSEIGWDGPTDELVMFMLIGGCQCLGEGDMSPILDPDVKSLGISFQSHRKFKSVFQLLFLKDKK